LLKVCLLPAFLRCEALPTRVFRAETPLDFGVLAFALALRTLGDWVVKTSTSSSSSSASLS
jgi:hypothetical protein